MCYYTAVGGIAAEDFSTELSQVLLVIDLLYSPVSIYIYVCYQGGIESESISECRVLSLYIWSVISHTHLTWIIWYSILWWKAVPSSSCLVIVPVVFLFCCCCSFFFFFPNSYLFIFLNSSHRGAQCFTVYALAFFIFWRVLYFSFVFFLSGHLCHCYRFSYFSGFGWFVFMKIT